jgi:hypothetical protein
MGAIHEEAHHHAQPHHQVIRGNEYQQLRDSRASTPATSLPIITIESAATMAKDQSLPNLLCTGTINTKASTTQKISQSPVYSIAKEITYKSTNRLTHLIATVLVFCR